MSAIEPPDNLLEIRNATMRVSRIESNTQTMTANLEVGTTLAVSGNTTLSSNLVVGGNVSVGTANLFVDTVSSNVGVGTNLPLAKLDVKGGIKVESNIVMLNTANTAQNVELSVGNHSNAYTKMSHLYPYSTFYSDASTDCLGYNVAISGDGKVITATAIFDDSGATTDTGSVYVFTQNSLGEWNPVQRLYASDAATNDRFGGEQTQDYTKALGISTDGSVFVVGAFRDDDTAGDTGSAYIFEKSGSTWSQVQKIVASDAALNDHFGMGVCISGNGACIAVGAPYEDPGGSTTQGSVYMFEKVGSTWTQTQKLVQSDTLANTIFGTKLALSDDGTTLAVAAAHHDNPTGSSTQGDAGAAYIFDKAQNGTWSQTQKIYPSDGAANEHFGYGIDISGDGTVVAVGQSSADGAGAAAAGLGAVYVYVKSGGAWSATQTQKIVSTDNTSGDAFGHDVALSQNGDRLLVGAPRDDDTQTDNGAIYIFDRTNGVWTQTTKHHAVATNNSSNYDGFGTSVSISGDGKVYIGGHQYQDVMQGGSDQGGVYVYDEKFYIDKTAHLKLNHNFLAPNPIMFSVTHRGLGFTAGSGPNGPVVIKFNIVELNKGGGYNPETGLFTAPITGYYKFDASTTSTHNAYHVMVGFYKNGNRYQPSMMPNEVDAGVNTSKNTTGSIIANLEAGDTFSVNLIYGWIDAAYPSGFTGFYLSA